MRLDIRNIPDETHATVSQWCESAYGLSLNSYIKFILGNIARQFENTLTLTMSPITLGRYRKLCVKLGTTPELRLAQFIQEDLERHS